jgi:AAA15 family ATPase/GTPase
MASSRHHRNLLKEKYFHIFFPSQTMKRKMNDATIIVGKKGSGKTSLALALIKLYHKFKPRDHIYVFTQVPENYDEIRRKVLIIDINKMIEDFDQGESAKFTDLLPEISELQNSLVVLDDVESIPQKTLNSYMTRFINLLFQNGRNYNIQIILILHHLNRGNTSTQMIKEADALVIFPDSFDYNTLNTLVHHYGFSRQKAMELFNAKEKFLLLRNTNPMYLFGGSTLRTYPLDKI